MPSPPVLTVAVSVPITKNSAEGEDKPGPDDGEKLEYLVRFRLMFFRRAPKIWPLVSCRANWAVIYYLPLARAHREKVVRNLIRNRMMHEHGETEAF